MRKQVLWGHGLLEYQAMFDLQADDWTTSVLEYGCGPSAVNALCHKHALRFVSCDPLFSNSKKILQHQVDERFEIRAEFLRMKDHALLDMSTYGGVEGFIEARRLGCRLFFEDYEQGCQEGRYLSTLPVPSSTRDIFQYALSSHYFFSEPLPDQARMEEEIRTIQQLAQQATEVRIFPIIDTAGQTSVLLGPMLMALQQAHYGVEVRQVPYTLYPKGNAMLRVWAQTCPV